MNEVDDLVGDFDRLSLDTAARVRNLRAEIVRVQAFKACRYCQVTLDRYTHGAAAQQRSFFARFSLKYDHKGAVQFGSSAAAGAPGAKANAAATDWIPVMQQQPTQRHDIDSWFDALPAPTHALDWTRLTRAGTDDETERALGSLRRGKASGPDRMPNDKYKDLPEVVPFITAVFNACLESGQLPASFADANVYIIPKVAEPRSRLDGRPIALLNSDYKVVKKILADRLTEYMGELIHIAQSGFVSGRQIHDTLNWLSAARKLVRLDWRRGTL